MHPGDVLVPDAFDAVGAKAVVKNGRTLESLAHGYPAAGVLLLETVPGGEGAGRTGSKADPGKIAAGIRAAPFPDGFKGLGNGIAGNIVMP
jgi:hypothetical protein